MKKQTNQLIKRFPISDAGLSSQEKLVLKKLEKAAELIALIYEEQINDRYPGANFYPHDATKEEILKGAENNPLILNPYTIVERKKGQLEAIPYHVKYAKKLQPIIKLLNEAANLATNKEFARRLEVQADALETGTYDAADIYWLSMKPHKIDVTIGPAERYEDRLFFKKTCYSAVVGVMDEKATKEAIKIRDAILSAHRKSFSLSQRVELANRLQIRVDDTPILAGLDARASFSGAFLPVDPSLMEKYGGQVIIFNSSAKNNFDTKYYPIFKGMFEKSFQKSYTPEILLDASQKLLLIREISTNLVKYHDAEARLGELYPTINEIASFTLAVKNAGSLLLKDVISQKDLEAMMIMLLCRACDSFSSAKKIKSLTHYSIGYAIMVNYFLKNGSLKEHEGFSWLNFTKMFVALTDLVSIFDRILAFGDIEDARRLIGEYGDVEPCLKLSPKI